MSERELAKWVVIPGCECGYCYAIRERQAHERRMASSASELACAGVVSRLAPRIDELINSINRLINKLDSEIVG